jgi:predicted transcriptional regulator
MSGLPYAKNLLWFVFASSKGGQNRIRIILALKRNPLNANQMSKDLRLNYKAIQHHIKVLEKNNMIAKMGEKYGAIYFISVFLEANMVPFNEIVAICTKVNKQTDGTIS